MAENSTIEWTDATVNFWWGCTEVGPGCDHCYAKAWDRRLGGDNWGPHAQRRKIKGAAAMLRRLNKGAKAFAAEHGRRRRVFMHSMSDMFDNAVPSEWRDEAFAEIKAATDIDVLVLTKRPGNIAAMLPPDWRDGYPNVWLGCTVVNQAEADRDIPKLLAVPARVRFLSMEPLLGPVDLTLDSLACTPCPHCSDAAPEWDTGVVECRRCDSTGKGDEWGVDLVIVGGESGPGARPMHPDWARSLRDQCVAAGVPFFFKQWGEYEADEIGPEDRRSTKHPPGHVVFRRVGKKAAGRKLGGQTWDQMPGDAA